MTTKLKGQKKVEEMEVGMVEQKYTAKSGQDVTKRLTGQEEIAKRETGVVELNSGRGVNVSFEWMRAREHIVLAAPAALNILASEPRFLSSIAKCIRGLNLPAGYDLLINPFFFTGTYYHRVEAVHPCSLAEDDVTFSTLANEEAAGFLYCFIKRWRTMVWKLEKQATTKPNDRAF